MENNQTVIKPMLNEIVSRSLISLLLGCSIWQSSTAAESSPVIELHAQMRMANMGANEDTEVPRSTSESTQLIVTLLERAGYPYKFSLSPWSRIFQLLETRPNILSYPVARIPDREDNLYWVGMMRPIAISLYGLRKNRDQLPTTLDAAKDFQVGVLRDDAIDNYLVSQGFENLVRFSNLENSLDMLQRERFDLFPFDAVGAERILQQKNLSADLLVPMVPLEAISTESFFVLSLSSDPDIKRRLRETYIELVEDGTFERIMGFEHDSQYALD